MAPARVAPRGDALRDDAVAIGPPPPAGQKSGQGLAPLSLKALVVLFVLFILVSSDVFTNYAISGFSGAVAGRSPTSYGIALQGIFLVIFYALALYLDSRGVL